MIKKFMKSCLIVIVSFSMLIPVSGCKNNGKVESDMTNIDSNSQNSSEYSSNPLNSSTASEISTNSGYTGSDNSFGTVSSITSNTEYTSNGIPSDLGNGRTFYISSSEGSDSNDGLSIDKPLQSVSTLNKETLKEGDNILFKRGDTWSDLHFKPMGSGSPSEGNWITIDAYGTGAKPVFTDGGSVKSAISLCSLTAISGYRIRNLEIRNYWGGISLKKNEATPFVGLDVENCDFYDITSNSDFGKEVIPDGAPWSVALYFEGVQDLTVKNIITRNCDGPAFLVGNNMFIDNIDAYRSAIYGIELWNTRTAADLSKYGGNITLQNSKFYYMGFRGDYLGTASIFMENTKDVLIKNCEVAYTVNRPYSVDGCAIDFESNNMNTVVDSCYIHDNEDAAFLAMEHSDTLGNSYGITIKNTVSINNGRRNSTYDSSFFNNSCYNNASKQYITFENCIDINMGSGLPTSRIEGKAYSMYDSNHYQVSNCIFGAASVAECFDDSELDDWSNTSGASIVNGHLSLSSGTNIKTNYAGSDYVVQYDFKGDSELVFRENGDGNSYAWQISSGKITANKKMNGSLESIKDISVSNLDTSAWNRIKVELSGTTINTYVNEALVDTIEDSTFSSGGVGLNSSSESMADNFFVYELANRNITANDYSIADIANGGSWSATGTNGDWPSEVVGWTCSDGVADFQFWPHKNIIFNLTSGNAYIEKSDVSVNVTNYKKVHILLYNATGNSSVTVRFLKGDTWYDKEFSVRAMSVNDGAPFDVLVPGWREYIIDMSDIAQWTGTITGFRLAFGDNTGFMNIAYVKIAKN